MKIDLDVYWLLIDLRKLFKSGICQVHDVDDLGINDFLDCIMSMDIDVLCAYKRIIELTDKINGLKPGTKIQNLKQHLAYDSVEELKADLIMLPHVTHQEFAFGQLKLKMEQIYKDNPEIFEDLVENDGLIKTLNSLVETYNIKNGKNENQNI